jgi:probable F420-dependent oxidoreductase
MEVGVVMMRATARSAEGLRQVGEACDLLGYHSVWLTEHTVIPVDIGSRYPYSQDGVPPFRHDTQWPEAMVSLGFLAALTRRVRLGTAVIPMTTRDPISLAKQAATVDVLSGGRLELGVGAGWLVEEAEVLGRPHDARGARLDEAIDIMRKAWTQSSFAHEGRFWKIPAVGVHPQPVQGADLPIWIGGTSPAALRTTASRAAGNIVWLGGRDEVAWMRSRLPAGRRVAAAVRLDFRNVDMAARAVEAREAGADRLLLVAPRGPSETVADLERFASEVVPSL